MDLLALDEHDLGIARGVLGDHRFDDRLEAVRRYCGGGAPRSTFLAVLDKVDLGSLSLVLTMDNVFDVRPGVRSQRAKPRRGQARA